MPIHKLKVGDRVLLNDPTRRYGIPLGSVGVVIGIDTYGASVEWDSKTLKRHNYKRLTYTNSDPTALPKVTPLSTPIDAKLKVLLPEDIEDFELSDLMKTIALSESLIGEKTKLEQELDAVITLLKKGHKTKLTNTLDLLIKDDKITLLQKAGPEIKEVHMTFSDFRMIAQSFLT